MIFSIFLAAVLAIGVTQWLTGKLEIALKIWRKSLPWIGGLAIFAIIVIQGGLWLNEEIAVSRLPEAKPGSPNIILIVIGTLRADHLASYGYYSQTSPNMDRLAAECVLFETAISPSDFTPYSHAQFLMVNICTNKLMMDNY